jgi:hypothetical protein
MQYNPNERHVFVDGVGNQDTASGATYAGTGNMCFGGLVWALTTPTSHFLGALGLSRDVIMSRRLCVACFSFFYIFVVFPTLTLRLVHVDEVRVYLRPLSASEILGQYHRNEFLPSSLTLYLPFNNGTIADYSGSSGVNVMQNISPYHRGAWPDIAGGGFPRCLCTSLLLFTLYASMRLSIMQERHVIPLGFVLWACFAACV